MKAGREAVGDAGRQEGSWQAGKHGSSLEVRQVGI